MAYRIIALIITICLTFSLFAVYPINQNNTTQNFFWKEMSSNAILQRSWIKTYEEYEKELFAIRQNSNYVTTSFVTYADIALVGDFVGYADFRRRYEEREIINENPVTTYISAVVYEHIAYACRDITETKIELHIFETGMHTLPENEEAYADMNVLDAACIDSASHMKRLLLQYNGGFVDIGNVRYIYTHGKLQGIKWVYVGYEFMLSCLDEYPTDRTDTFAGKMLDPTLAPIAIAAFIAHFNAARGELI